ncbi:MAG: small ribosomal subunit biogenesis GTPase RsgA, partial [Thermosynechococcaceae cyanobacterium]
MTDAPNPSDALTGIVVAVQANYYRVKLSASGTSSEVIELLCTRRSRLKKLGQQIMVGDRVGIEEPDWQGGRGAIATLSPRTTQLQRPPVANANQVLLMFALTDPPLDALQLTRLLVTVAVTELRVVLCLNKQELVSLEKQQQWQTRLRAWGYEPTFMSLYAGTGLAELHNRLEGQLTVVSGPSGVGKSSLINHLIPDREVRVGTVSDRWGQGKHTTRHVELFDLPGGGLLTDTPGFNQPSTVCAPQALAQYFPEARQRLEQEPCRFNDCLHRDEPHCVVRGDWERYPYYLTLLEEVIAEQGERDAIANVESTLKRKTKGKGKTEYEPKLSSKRYRRPSRRSQRQDLNDLYPDRHDTKDGSA